MPKFLAMKKLMPIAIITGVFMLGIWLSETKPNIKGRQPVPTEFDINKSKRKDFKNQRKEYIKNMHRAHPDVDWEKMDAESRKIRTEKVDQIRQDIFYSGDLNPGYHNFHWNAQNFQSGLYLYQLRSGKNILTKKMLLLK